MNAPDFVSLSSIDGFVSLVDFVIMNNSTVIICIHVLCKYMSLFLLDEA